MKRFSILSPRITFGFVLCLVSFNVGIIAASRGEHPVDAFASAGIIQNPGVQVPLNLEFRDAEGQIVRLANFTGTRPILLIPGYFKCTNLCDIVRQTVQTSLRSLSLTTGKDFEVVAFSFDPSETPADALQAEADFMAGSPNMSGSHFLVGDRGSIDPLMDAIGFEYAYDPETQQYAHPAGIVLLTPTGAVSRYFFGLQYPPEQLRLGLVEASGNQIGNAADQVLLRCFHYDPVTGKYSLLVSNITIVADIGTVLVLGVCVGTMIVQERRLNRKRGG